MKGQPDIGPRLLMPPSDLSGHGRRLDPEPWHNYGILACTADDGQAQRIDRAQQIPESVAPVRRTGWNHDTGAARRRAVHDRSSAGA